MSGAHAQPSDAAQDRDAGLGPPPGGDDERSLSDLLSTLTGQLSTLFRKEIELVRTEVKQEVRKTGKAAGKLGGAGGAAYMAILLLSFALAWGLGELIPVWAGFLIVGLVYAVVAGVLYAGGRKQLDEVNPKPEQTVETLKEDAEWVSSRRS